MFRELGLNDNLIQAIEALGFETPTPIQEKAIPVLLSGTKDFIGLAQTGTGKTAAFGLPLLQLIDASQKTAQALVVCPTRELCMQIVEDMRDFKKFSPGIYTVAVYGGSSISDQIKQIKKGVQIVVATPGRLIDLIERKALNLSQIKYVVLDEADEMLNMGFEEDIEFVLKHTVNRESIWLFSATMPPEIRKVSKKYMENPAEISIGKVSSANKNIDHQFYLTSHHARYEVLKRVIDFHPGIYGLIFTRTKVDAQEITEKLTREGYDVDALHGDLSQVQRDKVMKAFRNKTLQLLIATDVAARGIDVEGITHVINFELPDENEVYTHRSGRTGRAGNTGICLSIVTKREMYKLKHIEGIIHAPFHKLEIPSGKDVCRKQFFAFMDKLSSADISHGDYDTYIPMLEEKFSAMSKEEVLTRVVALEFDRFLKYYENAGDLNIREYNSGAERGSQSRRFDRSNDRGFERGFRRSRGDRSDRGGNNRDEFGNRTTNRDSKGREFGGLKNGTKLFINLGSKDGFYKASFLQYILDMSELNKDVLGKVDVRETSSWVEIDRNSSTKMMLALDGKSYKGRKIRMNESY
ncbi:MAG TPA: ATP-dependent RNA helicase [Bacteroidetes bacterium]|nr:ATP-dependent RNA helicase [Bacteroidota bacterium]